MEFQYGDGHIIACSQTLEWGYRQRYSPLLENLLLYYRYSHELAVFLEAPLWLEPFSSSLLSATVYNFGLENESDVELRIMIDGSTVAHTIVPLLTTGSSQTITYLWNPTTIREYNITAYAPPVTGENFTIDNQVTRMADVRPPILILFDQTHGTDSIFHYGVWIESLAERGYIIETHDRASITGEALSSYDIFVVPQARHSYSSTELSAIQDFVLDGHGFLVVGDDYPDIYTSLTDFANITWVSGGRGGYTTDITPHPVTDGVDTAFFSSPVSRLLVESPAEDLIRDEKGYVMLAASEVGDGKVIGIADEHSINNHYISYADNLRLANNMIGWLFSLPEHDLRVTLESPRLLEPEASSILNITLQNRGLKEETDVALYLLMNDTQVSSAENITLGAGERHTLNYTWTPAATGTYNISGWTPPAPGDAYPENNKVCKMSKVTYIPRVAVLASWDIPPYFTGGWSNDYQTLVDALNNEGIYTRAVTNKEITNGILNGFDVFVMVDNVPNLDSVPYVTNFWSRGGGVVAFDSSICFLCYSGILPPESAGDHGYYTYWDYGTSSEAQIAYVHPVTEGYKLGQVIHGTAGDAEYKVEELVNTTAFPSYTMLVEDTTRPDRAYVSAYEPDAGRVIHIWDQHHWRNSGLQKMILNAMFWTPAPVADGAVHNLTVYPTEVYVGQTVNINVTIANEGETSENFTVTAYHGNVSSPKPPSSPPYPAGPRISLDPSENIFHLNETSIGHRFNVTAWVENAMSLGGAQIQLHFNDTILNVTRWFTVDEGDGGFMPSPITAFPEPPTPSYDHIGPGEGRVRLAVSKGGLPPTAPWGHDGKICILEFNITAVPPMGGSLSSTLHINNTYTYLLDTTANKIPDVIKEDGSYWLGHGLPPTPFIGEQTVYLPPMSNRTLAILWDTTGLPLGNYTVSAVVEPLVGERDIEDNCFTDGVVEILWQHDVAIRQLYCNRTWVYQGRNVTFTAEVENNGDFTENVTVILYYNLTSNSIIGNVTIPDLNPDQEETIRVVWNTTNVIPCVNYTITGVVSTGNPDSNPGDNRLEDGSVKIRYLGDLNGDDRIDLKDVFSVALAFGCLPGDPKWNPDYDINSDYQIDLKDVFSVAIRYGEC
ncbi:hypothetical protein GWN43_05235 [Candidatus Bathyarchaeota archaeon]|nr:hypothetical protein [Candidatus Bathyarchaeota archaeon]